MIEHRTLGQTGLQVSVLGFGGSEIGYAPITPDDLDRLLGNALDVGINVIDTAECYADSEDAIGQALSRSRHIDFANEDLGPGSRVALELSAASARELVRCIAAALASAGVMAR